MRPTLLLAWRYLAHHRLRSAIVVLCISLTFFLPLAVSFLVSRFEESMVRRALSVPLIVGPKGDRFELLMSSLYFRGRSDLPLTLAEVDGLREDGRCEAVPVLVRKTARGYPVVATRLEYFARMGLAPRRGNLPLRLGDAVLGADVAEALGLGPGSTINSDPESHIDISRRVSLKMRVTGVLEKKDSPDDGAVFVEMKTGWVIEGVGHGHQSGEEPADPDTVLKENDGEVVYNDSLFREQEITEENIGSFHFHGAPEDHPISAVLVWPKDRKESDILRARYRPRINRTAQVIVPEDVVMDLLGMLFKVKLFFDANVIMVSVATSLFLGLVVLLTLRIRKREMETLFKIGCSRLKVFSVMGTELSIIVIAGLVVAAALSAGVYAYVARSGLIP